MVSTFYPPYHFGGDALFVRALSRALAARGHHVEVIHCEDAYRLGAGGPMQPTASQDADEGIVVHRLQFGPLSPLITQQTSHPGLKRKAIARVLEQGGFDVVNFHNISLVGGLGVLALSRTARLNLYTLHEHWLLCPTHSFWKNRTTPCDKPECLRCCLRSGIPPQLWRYTAPPAAALRQHVDAMLSPSAYTAERHREMDQGLPVLHLPTFSSLDPGSHLPFEPHARPRFVSVSRVTASKGVDQLVAAFARLPQYDLDVAGTGDLLERLRQTYSGCPNIRFHGETQQQQLAKYYRGAQALIVPSLAPEVFPLCTLEAFACSTPAIVHDAGGNREAVDTSGAGFVYRTKAELLHAIDALAGSPDLRDRMGRKARAAFEQLYNEQRYMNDYLALIERMLQEKENARRVKVSTA